MNAKTLRKLLKNPDYDYKDISLQNITPDYVLKELKILEKWFEGTEQEKEYKMRFVRLKRIMYFDN